MAPGNKAVPFWRKCATDFWKIRRQFWGKSVTDFGEIRFWEKHVPFLGQTGSVFGTKWLRFGENRRSLGVNLVRFLDWLGTSSSLTVLNAKRVWVWIFEFSGLGVTKNKSSCGKLEG